MGHGDRFTVPAHRGFSEECTVQLGQSAWPLVPEIVAQEQFESSKIQTLATNRPSYRHQKRERKLSDINPTSYPFAISIIHLL